MFFADSINEKQRKKIARKIEHINWNHYFFDGVLHRKISSFFFIIFRKDTDTLLEYVTYSELHLLIQRDREFFVVGVTKTYDEWMTFLVDVVENMLKEKLTLEKEAIFAYVQREYIMDSYRYTKSRKKEQNPKDGEYVKDIEKINGIESIEEIEGKEEIKGKEMDGEKNERC